MKKTVFLAVFLPLFITSCSLFDKKKEVEEITEEVTPAWTSTDELTKVENEFADAFGIYCQSYSGGYQQDIRDAFKATMASSILDANQTITSNYHDWRAENPFADGDTWIVTPDDESDYLYDFFEDYAGYFSDWRTDYTVYGEATALDSLQNVSVAKIDAIIDETCQSFIENWRIGGD